MKGIVFATLNSMVEEKLGFDAWQAVLDDVKPESGGIYTAGASYSDQELFKLVGAISKRTGISVPDLVRSFGEFMLGKLAIAYPKFFEGLDAKEFLKSIDSVIHVEVKKLYPDAGLPTFAYEDQGDPQRLVMNYRSPRALCQLAEGLIQGAAKYYQTKIGMQHERCIHEGSDHCRFVLTFNHDERKSKSGDQGSGAA